MTRSNRSGHLNRGASRVAMTLALSLMVQAAPAWASPTGGDVVSGQASIFGDAGGNVTVTQTTDRAVINWDSFSIANNETVVFRQPGAQSITANRVLDSDPSRILGSMQANGRVILINRNGVVFGKDSNVDAAGLVVSTHDLDQSAFMAGGNNLRFSNGGIDTAEIVVNGRISIRDAGLAAFVAPHVRNDGLIEAKLGRVALGAGRGFSVDLFGDGLINFAAGDEVTRSIYGVDGSAVSALVENSGTIIANGGQILLTASAARDIINASVNVSGVVRADSASNRNGIITLSGPGAILTDTSSLISASGAQGGNINVLGGAVALGGIVDASSSGRRNTGGSVNVEAQGLLSLGGTVKASSAQGVGGSVVYRAGRVMENSSGVTDVHGLSDGGTISAIAAGNYATSGAYLAGGLFGNGGRIDVTGGGTVSLLSANLSASGRNMGGLVRAGGPFQGDKTFDGTASIYDTFIARWSDMPVLPHAANLFVNDSTRINVSALRGAGGSAILWSDNTTTFLGAIDARGWTPGSVEISSAESLRYASLENINTGPGGTVLLDPKNIIIGTAGDMRAWSYAGVLNLTGGVTPQSNGVALEALDNFGRSVSLNAAGDRLAVGAFGDDGFANNVSSSGAVYLFSFSDANFSGGTLQAIIGSGYTGGKNVNLSTLDTNDQFGTSASLNATGDRLAVGANGDDGVANGVSSAGAAYLFSFSDANFSGGTLQATIGSGYSGGKNVNLSTLEASDFFGRSVSLNATGDRLAVGANGDDGVANGVSSAGAAYLFSFSDANFSGGTLQAVIGSGYTGGKNINLAALETGDSFGTSVSLNAVGDRLAVGAIGDDGSANSVNSAGAVYLFSFSDTVFSGGTLQATIGSGYTGGKNISLSALALSDQFGTSVSLNAAGDRLAVGAIGDDGATNNVSASGAVYLFSFSDTDYSNGALQAVIGKGYTGGKNINLAALTAGDSFGTSLSLNAAGDRLAVGALGDDGFSNNLFSSGAVYLFVDSTITTVNYAANPSDTINISAAALSTLLRSGSNVVLQASNDITVNNAISVATGGSGVGTLNLNAGRSILINANIATQGGNVVLIGNSTAASGVVDVQRDPGAAAITMAPGTSIDAGTGSISVLIDTGAGLTNSTSGDISLGNLTGSAITVRNAGPTASSGIILNNGAQLSASGSGNAITLVGQKFVNNTGATALSAANGFWRIWSNNPSNDTVGGLALDYKQYGLSYAQSAVPAGIGNGLIYSFAPTLSATLGASSKPYDTDRIATPASLAFSGVLSGDVLTLPTWTSALYNTKDVGANKTVTVTGLGATITSGGKPVYGYVLPSSVSNTSSSITPASLAITGVAAQNKVYDGTLSATLTGGSVTALGSDVVSLVTTGATGSFANKNVGNSKAVTASGYTLTGTDAGNYTLVQPTGLTANITPVTNTVWHYLERDKPERGCNQSIQQSERALDCDVPWGD